jgi:hypothetical protein
LGFWRDSSFFRRGIGRTGEVGDNKNETGKK